MGVPAAGSGPRLCRPAGNRNLPTSQRKYAHKYVQVIHGRRYRWLISYMTPHSDGTPTNIRRYFIFLENRPIGLHFAAYSIGLPSLKIFWWVPEFLFISARGRSGRSRASEVTDIGASRKRVCDFQLVRNSNPGPILHRFGDQTGFMCFWLFNPNFGGAHQIAHVGR